MQDSWIGRMLGDYEIEERIGQGGMAVVYRAQQRAMNRSVAIKMLAPAMIQVPDFIKRFEREVRTIAGLEHARILPVHDYGSVDGVPYLVMRYLRGGTLRERIEEGAAMPPEEAGRILRQVAEGLAYAHGKHVIHRDVTTNNIMFDDNGDVLLTDFGLARISQDEAGVSVSSSMLGTPLYISPEQVMGEKVDHRADLYSLGIVLYEMLTGKAPFDGDNPMSVAVKHVNMPLPDPREANPALSPAVASVVLKACSKAPEDRYQNALEMAEAFSDALRHGIAADVTSRTGSGRTRFPVWIIIAALMAAALVIGGLLGYRLLGQEQSTIDAATATAAIARAQTENTEDAAPAALPSPLGPPTTPESGLPSATGPDGDMCGPNTEPAITLSPAVGFDALSGGLNFSEDDSGILIEPGIDNLLILESTRLTLPHVHLRGISWPNGPGKLRVLLFATEENEAVAVEIATDGSVRVVVGTDPVGEITGVTAQDLTIATLRDGLDVVQGENRLLRVNNVTLSSPQPIGFTVLENPIHLNQIVICQQAGS